MKNTNPILILLIVIAQVFFTTLKVSAQCQTPLPNKLPLGANINGLADYNQDRPFNDVFKTNRGFSGSLTAPWTFTAPLATDANGWPLQDFSVVVMADMDSTMGGIYKMRFNGQATLTPVASNFTVQNKTYNASLNSTTADLVFANQIPAGQQMMIRFTNTSYTTAIGGVKNIQIMRPGTTFTSQTFRQDFLNHLQRFSTIRFMDWRATNGNTDSLWSGRTTLTHPSQCGYISGKHGVAWEYCIELANTLGKDMWINVPHKADSNYIVQLATLIKTTLNPTLNVYTEYSNEVWNWSFVQATWNQIQANIEGNANGAINYDAINNPGTWHYRRIANQGKKISDIFKNIYGQSLYTAHVRPVYAVQIAYFDVGQRGLEFIRNYYGPPRNYFYGVGGAPYFSSSAIDTSNAATVANVNSAIQTSINKAYYGLSNSIAQYAAMSRYYSLKLITYEGGPDTFGPNNINTKLLASRSSQMKVLCSQMLSEWYKYGPELFLWYTAGATKWNTQYGTWGLTEKYEYSNKLKAMDSMLLAPVALPSRGWLLPANIDARKFEGYTGTYTLNTAFLPSTGIYYYLVNVPSGQAGTYQIKAETKCAQNGASFAMYVNDTLVQTVNVNNNNNLQFDTVLVGSAQLKEGLHSIRFKKITGNYSIRNYLITKTANCINLATGVGNRDDQSKSFSVYPNPNNGEFYISANENIENAGLKVTDIMGKIIFQQLNIHLADSPFSVNIKNFNAGIYFITVKNSQTGSTTTTKIIKQ